MLLAFSGFALSYLAGANLDAFKLGINPFEFLLKALGKMFYLGVALGASQYIVYKFFPTIDTFCKRDKGGTPSLFSLNFEIDPNDPRLWHSVFAHVGVFVGVCLILALAF